MTLGLVVVAVLGGLGDDASRALVERFERLGRAQPETEPALSAAAATLARTSALRGADAAVGALEVARAISAAGGWDAQPVVLAFRGSAADILSALSKEPRVGERPASHVGVAAFGDGATQGLAVILAQRRVRLDPVPRRLASASTLKICAAPAPEFSAVDVFVTTPAGAVLRAPLGKGTKRCTPVRFAAAGRHVIELLGQGASGPVVLALFFVDLGPVTEGDQALPDPPSEAELRPTILRRVAELRASQGAPPLASDPVLDGVAQAYAQRMAEGRFHAHRSPGGDALPERLAAAGYEASSAAECLGTDHSALAAQFGIEHSPAHRAALLDRRYRAIGLGVARDEQGTTNVVEVLAEPLDAAPAPAVFAAIQRVRRELGLPPLAESPVAEAIARDHLRRAVERRLAKLVIPGAPDVQQRALSALPDAAAVAVDVLVLSSPGAAARTVHLANPEFRQLGLAAELVRVSPGVVQTWAVAVYVAP